MDKRRYFTRKILNAVLTIVLVASFNFVLFRIMPGNPARLLLPKGQVSAAAIAQQKAIFHLDKPLWEQFVYYWADTAEGKFGNSFAQRCPVAQIVGRAHLADRGPGRHRHAASPPSSAWSKGVFAGWRRNGKFDVASTNIGMVLYSMPTFWVPCIVIMLFSVALGWFPVGRMLRRGRHLHQLVSTVHDALLHHIFLPVFMFAIGYMRRVPPDHAQLDDRRDEGGLRPHGAGQGAVRQATCSGGTSCPTPCCPPSPS